MNVTRARIFLISRDMILMLLLYSDENILVYGVFAIN